MLKKNLLLLAVAFLMASCVSEKKIVYYGNDADSRLNSDVAYETTLQPDDLLMIIVSAPDPEAAIPYNLPSVSATGANFDNPELASAQERYQTYLVDNKGDINFPGIGVITVGGLTRAEAIQKLTTELTRYIKKPIVNLRILNYKVSVMGEVVRPGSYSIPTERVTLPEALSLAGDLTIYGNRNNILLIREVDGKRTFTRIDLTKPDFLNSDHYYLTQNDVIYVQPNKTRVNSSVIGPNITVGISALSLLITIIALATR